ncbi:DUF3450 family protein [candidate division FCPU426 bacterium]|nr:DUF3450 family protein [candidate division FCPU426 bacterium]
MHSTLEKRFGGLTQAVALLLLSLCLPVRGLAAEEPDSRNLEKLVNQWVLLKKEITLEKQNWSEEREYLRNEQALLATEKKRLEEEIGQLRAAKAARSALRLKLLESKQSYQQALEACLPALRQAEKALQAWTRRLPRTLFLPVENNFIKLPSASEQPVSQRLQNILALYAQIDKYQNSINVGKEMIVLPDGNALEFDVLFIGLAQGYCLSQDGRQAGIGWPDVSGWKWEWRPSLAARIRSGLILHAQEKVAEFIALPVRVQKEHP